MRRIASCALAVAVTCAITVSAGGPGVSAAPKVVPAAGESAFTAVSPVRVLDTRTGLGTGGSTTPVGPAGTVTLDLTARVPASASAVVLNVTGVAPTKSTFITVFPDGSARPTASNLNLVAGEIRPNLVTVALGTGRKLVLYNNSGSTHLVADLTGFYATGAADATGRYTAFAAYRVFDSRVGFEFRPPGPIGPRGTDTIDLSRRVPASATAVTLNLTGTGATTSTFITAWPSGTPRPTASNLNLVPGATSPNLVTVALGADRKVSLYNNSGNTHVIADLAGFYTPDYGALFTPRAPTRVLDTRNGTGGVTGPVNPGGQIELVLGLVVPFSTTAVVLNLTGTQPTASTFVSAWPRLEPRSDSSNLNLSAGQTAANLSAVGVGTLASVSLYNNAGTVHLIADLAGFFSLPQVPCTGACVYAWGSNDYGQLGTGNYSPASANPQPVYGLSDVVAVSGGADRGYALRADGTVWAWGENSFGDLGNGWSRGKSVVPVPVMGLDHVIAIDGSLALRDDGTVWAWSLVPSGGFDRPGQVPGLSNVIAVAAGLGVGYALRADGTVWAWGSNGFGALGNGEPENFYAATPVQVSGLTGVRKIAAVLYGALALRDDGTLWSWGDNRQGQLGNGTVGGDGCYFFPPTGPCFSNVPVQVTGLSGVSAIGADSVRGFAVLTNGTAWAWGNNNQGALGIGQECDAVNCAVGTPGQLVGLANARSITGMEQGGYALDADGRVWAWGDNSRGELGPVDGNPGSHSTVPLRLREPTGVTAITAGLTAGFALVP